MKKEKGGRKEETIDVVIETPRGCRNKYAYDKKARAFRLKKIMPAGAVFPFDFGFIPDTEGEDGDPLDVLVIMDEAAYPGCIVECRIVGVLLARQSDGGKMIRNDRLIAVSVVSQTYVDILDVEDVNENVRGQIEHFFVSYNKEAGKEFVPDGWEGAKAARKLIR
jgi:inorganic pyrophosphatase